MTQSVAEAFLSQAGLRFDGETYEAEHDRERLRGQLERVRRLMVDGQWRSLRQIAAVVGGTEAAVSARLRDLRKERFGSWEVERRALGSRDRGLFSYRVLPPKEKKEKPVKKRRSSEVITELRQLVATLERQVEQLQSENVRLQKLLGDEL